MKCSTKPQEKTTSKYLRGSHSIPLIRGRAPAHLWADTGFSSEALEYYRPGQWRPFSPGSGNSRWHRSQRRFSVYVPASREGSTKQPGALSQGFETSSYLHRWSWHWSGRGSSATTDQIDRSHDIIRPLWSTKEPLPPSRAMSRRSGPVRRRHPMVRMSFRLSWRFSFGQSVGICAPHGKGAILLSTRIAIRRGRVAEGRIEVDPRNTWQGSRMP